jgi:uncharacterized protein
MARRVLVAWMFVAALMMSSTAAFSQTSAGPSGHWEGAIQVPAQEIKIELDLARTGEKWEGTITIPAQGLKGLPLSAVAVSGETVSFAIGGIPGEPTFKGTLAQDAKTLAGDFTQGGGKVPFSVARTGEAKIERPPNSTPITKDLEGSWEGAVDINGTILRLVAKLSNQPDGLATGTLTSVDQGGVVIPIAAVVQTGAHLRLVVPAVIGNYEGDLKDGQLSGTWTQGPNSWPLVLKRK